MKIAKKRITPSKAHDILWPNDFIGDFLFITTNKSDEPEYYTYLYLNGEGCIGDSCEPFIRRHEPSRHHIFKQI